MKFSWVAIKFLLEDEQLNKSNPNKIKIFEKLGTSKFTFKLLKQTFQKTLYLYFEVFEIDLSFILVLQDVK